MTKRANPPALSRALVQDNVPAMVTERLWIGSIHAAFNSASMQARGITHVLNASGLPATFPRQFTYFTVDIRDRESSNILTAIGAVNIFVEAGIEKGGVLVHCAGGRSRSAAFVVAFIMSTQGCSYDTAYAQVRRARPVASVNPGFEQQLRAYGAAQCDVFAAHQMMLRVRAGALLDRRNLLLLRRSSGGASSEAAGGGGGEGGGGGAGGAAEQAKLPPPPSAQPQGAIGVVAGSGSGSVSTTGIPPTPRSPRGRGRSPAAGNPTTYRQRRGSGGAGVGSGDGGSAAATGPVVAAAPSAGKGREDKTQFLPKEPRPTRFRLCRPESAPVQVIPPLKNLERVYACKSCGAFLLTGGHIIKNMDLPSLQAVLVRSSPRSSPGQPGLDVSAATESVVTEGSTAYPSPMATFQLQSTPCGGGSCCSGCSGSKDSVGRRGRGDRRSPSPLSERRGQSRVTPATATATATTPKAMSSDSPTTRRSTAERRPPPPLRVMTTELGLDRPPVHNRWVPEGCLPGVPTCAGTGAGAAATAAGAAAGPTLPGAPATVGGAGGVTADGLRVQSPVGHTPSPSRLKACAAGRGNSGATGGRCAGWTGDVRCGDGQRNSTVFVFESEDDSSTVDPSEREGMLAETSSLGVDVLHSGSADRSVSSAGSGAGGSWEVPGAGGVGRARGERFRGGRMKNAVGTPPNAAVQVGDFNFLLSSKVPLSAGSGMESVSPLMTPRSPRTPASCGSASPCASDASFSTSLSRPQSAEKRQFLMRMNVDSRTSATPGPSNCPETDSQTERLNSRPACRWLHVDLLDWMGDIMAAPTGRICCPNVGCGIELGNWTWEKQEVVALKSPTGPPLIRLDKAHIKTTSMMRSNLDSRCSLSRDNTPKSSPKSSSAPAANAVNTLLSESDLKRSSGILESRLAGVSASPQHQWQARQEPRGSPPG